MVTSENNREEKTLEAGSEGQKTVLEDSSLTLLLPRCGVLYFTLFPSLGASNCPNVEKTRGRQTKYKK